jgi:NAD+ synthase
MTLQETIINELGVKPTIDPKEEIRRSINFLKDYLKSILFKNLCFRNLGGQDSTLAGRLAQLTMEEMAQKQVTIATNSSLSAYLMVCKLMRRTPKQHYFIKPDVSLTINIKESTDAMVVAVNANGLEMSDFNKGNVKARMRMIAQYAIAGERKGSCHWYRPCIENITGFFTKHGDGGADILLYRLNKRQGKQLLAELGADEKLYLKVPTADLEETN